MRPRVDAQLRERALVDQQARAARRAATCAARAGGRSRPRRRRAGPCGAAPRGPRRRASEGRATSVSAAARSVGFISRKSDFLLWSINRQLVSSGSSTCMAVSTAARRSSSGSGAASSSTSMPTSSRSSSTDRGGREPVGVQATGGGHRRGEVLGVDHVGVQMDEHGRAVEGVLHGHERLDGARADHGAGLRSRSSRSSASRSRIPAVTSRSGGAATETGVQMPQAPARHIPPR